MGRFAAMVIAFALIFAMVVPEESAYSGLDDDGPPPQSTPAIPPEDSADEEASADQPSEMELSETGITIQRGADGQFHMVVAVNGQELPFLVDTGADEIALTVEDARSAGVAVDPEQFEPVGMGAGGVVEGQRVRLDNVQVAGRDIGAMDAVVLDGLTHNLLGQSVLREIASLELAGDTMTLR